MRPCMNGLCTRFTFTQAVNSVCYLVSLRLVKKRQLTSRTYATVQIRPRLLCLLRPRKHLDCRLADVSQAGLVTSLQLIVNYGNCLLPIHTSLISKVLNNKCAALACRFLYITGKNQIKKEITSIISYNISQ